VPEGNRFGSVSGLPTNWTPFPEGEFGGYRAGTTLMLVWWIKESKDINFNADCGFLTSQQPPSEAECPYGYVMFATVEGVPNSAIYYAPGTYHVGMDASQIRGYGDILDVTTTATITVTP